MSEIRVDTISEKTSANGVAVDGVTIKDGGIAATDGSTITTADNTDTLTLISTDADATVGPNLNFYRNSGSPADNDDLGKIVFNGRNDNSQDVVYAQIRSTIVDASDGTEDGLVKHDVSLGGTAYQHLSMGNGSIVFNEESQDIDFRVESNGNANMLFVNGGTDKVGIATNAPTKQLGIGGTGDISLEGSSNAIAFYDSAALKAYITSQSFGDHNGDGLGLVTSGDEPIKFFANGGERMRIDSTGAVTMPSQPAFLAIISGTQSNIANGNTIAFGTEVYDQNADFASNTFTAPVTGKYQFNFLISVTELDFDATFHRVQLVTSNRTFNFDIKSSQHYTADPNYATFDGSMCVDMDASDTAVLKWSQSAGNSSSDVFDSTYFSGHLAC